MILKEQPLLLVYDHHLSHVSVNVMEITISGDTANVKFPPPMWQKGPRETLSKSTFVNLICFIWYQGLSVETTISGFRATWIYLRDKIKCSTNRFHPQLLKHYEHWVPIGKLEYIIEDLATSIKTLLKFNPCQETGAF